MLPTLAGVSLLTFVLANLAPGDAASTYVRRVEQNPAPTAEDLAAARHELGLDRPFALRYVTWAGRALTGDLGRSYATRRPVATEIAHRIPLTVQITLLAGLLAVAVAVPAGIVAAVHRGRLFDHAARLVSMAGASLPSFWLALLLISIVALRLDLVPTSGRQGWRSLVLPVMTLAAAPAATLSRFTRATILESLGQPHVRTARAKGAPEWQVVGRHALRPVLAPLVTAVSVSLGFLLSGAVIVETIFALPGVGTLTLDAIRAKDYPVIQGVVLYTGLTFVLINLVVDLSYTVIDARVARNGGT